MQQTKGVKTIRDETMRVHLAYSVIDIAMWFYRQALRDRRYMQPQKLQRLLYMAQGGFGALYHGRKLCPAIFIALESGPIEPNIYRLFEDGVPTLPVAKLPPEVARFLEQIWRKYGQYSTEFLNQHILSHAAYRVALRAGQGTEIPFDQIVEMFRQEKDGNDKKIKTADGRILQKWVPAGAKRLPKIPS